MPIIEGVNDVETLLGSMVRCTQCGRLKPVTEFYKDRSKPTGRQGECKRCRAEYAKRVSTLPKAIPAELRCSVCKVVKPSTEFYRTRWTPRGVMGACKQCKNAMQREYRRRIKLLKQAEIEAEAAVEAIGGEQDIKLFAEEQIESAVREMAELQAAMEQEDKRCKSRVARIVQESLRQVARERGRLAALRRSVKAYLRQTWPQGSGVKEQRYRFGIVRRWNGRITFELNSRFAMEMIDLP